MWTPKLINLLSLALLALLSVGSATPRSGGRLPPMDFRHGAILDQGGNFLMLWTPEEKDIVIEIQVATRGYVGLGFSPNGGMGGADIVLGWVDGQGKLHAHDRHAVGMMTPLIDDSQDVEILGGYENETHTVLRFSRPWNTCDKEHDFQLSGDTIRVIWAYSDEDPVNDYVMKKHTHRGTKSIFLQEPQFNLPQFGDDVWTWEVTMDNVSVSGDVHTMYWCQIFKAPPLERKTHVIGYVPIIKEENRQVVHHMLLYECIVPESEKTFEHWVGTKGHQCFTPNMPASWSSCRSPIITWAVGSEGEILPNHVGFPLREEHGGATYFMIEMHYDNPNYRKGIVDNSGLRIFLTENLREHDAGFLTLGHFVEATHIIPPGRMWNTVTHCDSECLTHGLPADGIKVFQALLHTHLLGKTITVRQLRNGRELPLVIKDMNYDFNYQQTRIYQEEIPILPGDSFITECGYDSRGKDTPTFGGESTQEEMCLAFLMYYPRMEITQCISTPEMPQIYTSLGIDEIQEAKSESFFPRRLKKTETSKKNAVEEDAKILDVDFTRMYKNFIVKAPEAMANMSMYDIIHDPQTWKDEEAMSRLQQQVASGPHKIGCLNRAQNLVEKYPKSYHYPDFVAVEYLDEECDVSHEKEAYAPVSIKEDKEVKDKEENSATGMRFSAALTLTCLTLIGIRQL